MGIPAIEALDPNIEPENFPTWLKPKLTWLLSFLIHGLIMSSRAIMIANLIKYYHLAVIWAILSHILIIYIFFKILKILVKFPMCSVTEFDLAESIISIF